jgi:hypothetical protein
MPYNPAILPLGIYPKDCKPGYNKGTCIPMFIAALFTIAKLMKHPTCSATDKLIKNTVLFTILLSHKEE